MIDNNPKIHQITVYLMPLTVPERSEAEWVGPFPLYTGEADEIDYTLELLTAVQPMISGFY